MCYDGRQGGVTSQREAWVLEGQWVWGGVGGDTNSEEKPQHSSYIIHRAPI